MLCKMLRSIIVKAIVYLWHLKCSQQNQYPQILCVTHQSRCSRNIASHQLKWHWLLVCYRVSLKWISVVELSSLRSPHCALLTALSSLRSHFYLFSHSTRHDCCCHSILIWTSSVSRRSFPVPLYSYCCVSQM